MSDRNDFENNIATVLVSYTRWIIEESKKRDIHRLYFLARDGWLMYHIAEKICISENIDIECSYFYCSRYSLRSGAYRFFDDSAYEKLFLNAYKQNARNMLSRAGFDEYERKQVYQDILFDEQKESEKLGRKEFSYFCTKVRSSVVFRRLISEKSETAYTQIMRYIGQERINRYKKIGIVDLGWTGSLQYTLRRLLDSSQIKTHITGFYMGLLETPPKTDGSIYVPWLFNEKNIETKSWFAHNLMECICSAPHGMTLGYRSDGEHIVPVLAKQENYFAYIEEMKKKAIELSEKKEAIENKQIILKLLHRLMFSPTSEDIEILSSYILCDDIGEQYHKPLVQTGKGREFRREILPFKLLHQDETDGFFWYCGSLKKSRVFFKPIYKTGYRLTKRMIEKRKLRRQQETVG